MYILVSGAVKIVARDDDGAVNFEDTLCDVSHPTAFGELALISGDNRAATVSARFKLSDDGDVDGTEPCCCLVVSPASYKNNLHSAHRSSVASKAKYLSRNFYLLKGYTFRTIEGVCSFWNFHVFPRGAVVVSPEDTRIYLITRGDCEARQVTAVSSKKEPPKVMAVLASNQIYCNPHRQTDTKFQLVARSEVKALRISRKLLIENHYNSICQAIFTDCELQHSWWENKIAPTAGTQEDTPPEKAGETDPVIKFLPALSRKVKKAPKQRADPDEGVIQTKGNDAFEAIFAGHGAEVRLQLQQLQRRSRAGMKIGKDTLKPAPAVTLRKELYGPGYVRRDGAV
jgi:hypothetical protein